MSGDVTMRVWVVVGESGEYSDHLSWIDSVHLTEEGAVRAIESKVYKLGQDVGESDLHDTYFEDQYDLTVFAHPHRHGNSWEVEGWYGLDAGSWHIEEFEAGW